MTQLEKVERYLRAQMVRNRERQGTPQAGARPFITISRQAGAGGHRLAQSLLETFAAEENELFDGWQVFDKRLCELVADDSTYTHSLDSLLAEEYRTRTDEFFHQILRSSVDQRAVAEKVFRVVRAVASVGKAIIIGRAGSEVTRDMDGGIHVRLIASETVRIHGVMDHYGIEEKAARGESKRLDTARARLLKTHFGVDIADPTRYDVVFNTDQVSIGTITDLLVVMVRNEISIPRLADSM
ncbi:MAG: cytidylate kinase-like family protein [Actinomycetota bacterium]|nr:cytidylate kinase-like family protein [Actinomycetota bacterium]